MHATPAFEGNRRHPQMQYHEKQIAYEPPALTVLGTVHGLTEGVPGGTIPDCLNVNHNTVSGAPGDCR
jgi:hypothetical protein